MELRDAILGRRSIRAFADEPLPPRALERLQEALLWAPSAGHLQARRFWFVTDSDLRARLGACSHQAEIFRSARLVVVGCTDERIMERYGERGRDLYAPQDVAASVQNLLLTVHDLGLGAVWVGAFEPDRVREALSLPRGLEPVVMVPVGRPAEQPEPEPRIDPARAFVVLAPGS